jgi:hypothetical protein
MFSEALREAAILIAVFGWLDKAVKNEPFEWRWGLIMLSFALALFLIGALIEVSQGR